MVSKYCGSLGRHTFTAKRLSIRTSVRLFEYAPPYVSLLNEPSLLGECYPSRRIFCVQLRDIVINIGSRQLRRMRYAGSSSACLLHLVQGYASHRRLWPGTHYSSLPPWAHAMPAALVIC